MNVYDLEAVENSIYEFVAGAPIKATPFLRLSALCPYCVAVAVSPMSLLACASSP